MAMDRIRGISAELTAVLSAARLVAVDRGSTEITTEDLLAGILETPESRARVSLSKLVPVDKLRRALGFFMPRREPSVADAVLGREAAAIVSSAIRTRSLRDEGTDSNDLLAAMYDVRDSVVSGILQAAGLTRESIAATAVRDFERPPLSYESANLDLEPSREWGFLEAVVAVGEAISLPEFTIELLALEIRSVLAVVHLRLRSASGPRIGTPRFDAWDETGARYTMVVNEWTSNGESYKGELLVLGHSLPNAHTMTVRLVGFDPAVWPSSQFARALEGIVEWTISLPESHRGTPAVT